MKASVLKEMIDNELEDLLHEERVNLMKMKMSHAVSPLENPQQIKFTRRNIARIMTELQKRKDNNQ
ncbi:MAG: 50S ribosomal protein L29 [Bacteroidota bacterium]|nr:50S ribosomal protein L29 [Bacteroidota bacterium]|tara:strand:+ start:80 stop:277 length:198 start_codon:yes stop_codon:yes gene_type:complete